METERIWSLTRRFMIFDGRISLSTDDNLAGLGNLRSTNQALNFKLDYGATEIINPMGNIHVTNSSKSTMGQCQRRC